MKWRVIFTDSESLTGVAPECLPKGWLPNRRTAPLRNPHPGRKKVRK